ncbi:MAG: hypothetical protein LC749_16785, partial [Actinobacteria bacterium]|nr:hypothetical protein [Actinomycetota bacterium]
RTDGGTPFTTPSTPAPSPPTSVYLSALTPSGGDNPQRGDVQLGSRDLPHSIFYTQPSIASPSPACENAPHFDCVATDYDLGDKGYRWFTADFGETNSSPSSGENAIAQWSVIVDSIAIKSRTYESNGPPLSLRVPLGHGHVLRLVVSTTEPGLSENIQIIWGNAKLS